MVPITSFGAVINTEPRLHTIANGLLLLPLTWVAKPIGFLWKEDQFCAENTSTTYKPLSVLHRMHTDLRLEFYLNKSYPCVHLIALKDR